MLRVIHVSRGRGTDAPLSVWTSLAWLCSTAKWSKLIFPSWYKLVLFTRAGAHELKSRGAAAAHVLISILGRRLLQSRADAILQRAGVLGINQLLERQHAVQQLPSLSARRPALTSSGASTRSSSCSSNPSSDRPSGGFSAHQRRIASAPCSWTSFGGRLILVERLEHGRLSSVSVGVSKSSGGSVLSFPSPPLAKEGGGVRARSEDA